MPRRKGSGTGINVVRKTLADGTVKTYFYNRATGERFTSDPRTPESAARVERSWPDGSLGALVAAYRASPDFRRELAERTRHEYGRYLDILLEVWGTTAVRAFERRHVFALRDQFADTPRTANYLVQVMRLLFTFGVDRGWRRDNPALRPKLLRTGEGYRPWEESEITLFRAHWAPETRERVLFELMVNTGQRTADVIAMQRGHIRHGEISVRQQKTGARVWVPVSADLAATLDPWLASHTSLMLIPSERTGGQLTVSGLRQIMRDAYAAAELPRDCVNHGLRYTAAVRLSELGCDWETIATITGHETVSMVRKYLAKRRAARLAITKLDGRGSDPSLSAGLRGKRTEG